MKVTPMIIPKRIREIVERMAADGATTEEMISRMRQEGLPKIHSIRLLSDAAPMKLGEAKIEVHKSPTWADRRASDDAFHEAAFKVLEAEIWPDESMNDVLRTGT